MAKSKRDDQAQQFDKGTPGAPSTLQGLYQEVRARINKVEVNFLARIDAVHSDVLSINRDLEAIMCAVDQKTCGYTVEAERSPK